MLNRVENLPHIAALLISIKNSIKINKKEATTPLYTFDPRLLFHLIYVDHKIVVV